ncbi:Alpha/Beta hydrolase protein [Baffinella frigidus]|nr:Alpha/Beta hydrolase protein [Cryptophyta sp. CCMP2293]
MNFFGQITDTWQALVDLVIRPPRHEYDLVRDLGQRRVMIQGKLVIREDIELLNGRGLVLKCSHFQPAEVAETGDAPEGSQAKLKAQQRPFPCVVYCHGNAGSRVDALPLLPILLPAGISVFAFDFAGAGKSEGNFLSLGHFEKDDLATAVDFLRSCGKVSRVGLWGHSMGAVTCIMYTSAGGDEMVSAMVCDSAFSSLDAVIIETAASAKQKLGEELSPVVTLVPDMMIPMAVSAIRRSIINQAGFDIRDVNPLQRARNLLLPALFAHADHDEMVAPYHSVRLHEVYGGNSTLLRFPGNHNSSRPKFLTDSVLHFFRSLLRPDDLESPYEGLVYHKATQQRVLGGTSGGGGGVRPKGFQSKGVTQGGEKCFHSGRTAGSLSLLTAMCLECNAELRALRPPPVQKSRRYPVNYDRAAAPERVPDRASEVEVREQQQQAQREAQRQAQREALLQGTQPAQHREAFQEPPREADHGRNGNTWQGDHLREGGASVAGAGGGEGGGCLMCEGGEEVGASAREAVGEWGAVGGVADGREESCLVGGSAVDSPGKRRGRRRGDEAREGGSAAAARLGGEPRAEGLVGGEVGTDGGGGETRGKGEGEEGEEDEGVAWGQWGDGGGSGDTAGISFQLSNISMEGGGSRAGKALQVD